MVERQVSVEFVFDRAADRELTHAYRMLVPERPARTAPRRDSDDYSQLPTAGSDGADEDRPAIGA
jgi:hypothetical protein